MNRFLPSTLVLPALFLLAACESTDEEPALGEVAINDALVVFTDEYDSVKKVTFSGEVESIVLNDVNGNELEVRSVLLREGWGDLLRMNVNYQDYVAHRPSGRALNPDRFTSIDGYTDTGFLTDYSNPYNYQNSDIQSSNGHYAFRIDIFRNNSVELQTAYFDESGMFKSSPVPDSKHVAHFTLADAGSLAFTTRDIQGSGNCKTHITTVSGSDRLEPQASTFYWVGASGSLYFLKSGETESLPQEIHRVTGDSELTTEVVGYEVDNFEGPCHYDIQWVGSIDQRTYFLRHWYNDIIEFDEETLDLRVLDTHPDRGLVGAATAGDYIYFWGDYPASEETDYQWVAALDQLDPISEVTTRIYEGDPILIGHIDNDTLWAEMSTPGLHNWIGRMDHMSTLTGPTPMTEVYRPEGTFDGGLAFDYVWLGR